MHPLGLFIDDFAVRVLDARAGLQLALFGLFARAGDELCDQGPGQHDDPPEYGGYGSADPERDHVDVGEAHSSDL